MSRSDDLLLHEEVLLLALRKEGMVEFGTNYPFALAGAILADLLLAERIAFQQDGKQKLVRVTSSRPIGDELLDECLEKIRGSRKPRTLVTWVQRIAQTGKLKHRVARRLVHRGILRADVDKVLFVFPRRIYPQVRPGPEKEIVERLRQAIFSNSTAVGTRTVVLLSLADGAGLLKQAFGKKKLGERKARIEQVTRGEATGLAARSAIEAMEEVMLISTAVVAANASNH